MNKNESVTAPIAGLKQNSMYQMMLMFLALVPIAVIGGALCIAAINYLLPPADAETYKKFIYGAFGLLGTAGPVGAITQLLGLKERSIELTKAKVQAQLAEVQAAVPNALTGGIGAVLPDSVGEIIGEIEELSADIDAESPNIEVLNAER